MTHMDDEDMTAAEFDRLLAAGEPVELDVRLRRSLLFTVNVVQDFGISAPRAGFVSDAAAEQHATLAPA